MNGSGTAMKNIDKVELRKMSQKYMRQAQSEAKSDHCLLCGKPMTSFCNSHSVPKFALKSIAENGEVVLASKLMGNEISDNKSGVNKSGTFHLICDNCDNSFFQDYESQEKLAVGITDMKDTSVVIAFYHKRDKNYQRLRHQFNSINKETKLMYLNYLIFAYSENYFISKKILNTLETDEALKKLSREINGIPNLGQVNLLDIQNWSYAPVSMNDIPNFLSREWAI